MLLNSSPATGPTFRLVAIGASAGGLEACTRLLHALPVPSGMAFILVQHMAPAHKDMLAGLLAGHTALRVVQAADRMAMEPEHLYVVPPGSYLSVIAGLLHLSAPSSRDSAPHRAPLPFDALLQSIATEYGSRATCIVLSGTGSDGSAGLRAVKAAGGLILAQDPTEAGYDGMPRSAIATGLVDQILPAARLPEAFARLVQPPSGTPAAQPAASASGTLQPGMVLEMVELLRRRTGHDFGPYKRGTLERRIERRMGLALTGKADAPRYLALLRHDPAELDVLAKDLLIHVTSFFRDPFVFGAVAEHVIPGLLQDRAANQPIRIWIPGCSTGEEAYALVILFYEAMEAVPGRAHDITLQVFASDIDAAAVAVAREGLYPPSITADVSASRLERFFIKEAGHGYRVHPDLRALVVFTVQDLLADPPFSRLDVVSCRNLLIYLGPEAQAQAISLFHFALKEGGTLLLGTAEAVSEADGRFKLVQQAARLYLHLGRPRPGELSFAAAVPAAARVIPSTRGSPGTTQVPRHIALANLCRQAVLGRHAPAAALCTMSYHCLYTLGPTDRYLQVAAGFTTPDLLAMARGTMRTRLRSALAQAVQGGPDAGLITVPGGRVVLDGHPVPFTIEVQPVIFEGETLLLVCFVDAPVPLPQKGGRPASDSVRVAALEHELDTMRTDLDVAHRSIELFGETTRAINEEALSVNEEYQSTSEKLLNSKEELQSLNEELQALNGQLQETLERQRITANDLQNIIYNTECATLFLDRQLNIRLFTPATKALFNVIPGDVGRPLADLHCLAADALLLDDARAVLHHLQPVEREVETVAGTWFHRRILPYRTDGNGIEGVVITFSDVTRRKQAAASLQTAKQEAEAANLAKSRFLAAASHDLRQPLQTLALLQGLLVRNAPGEKAARLLHRVDETLGAMTGMLDTLLDLNQIEAGVVQPGLVNYPIGPVLDRLRAEFSLQAEAKRLDLRVVPCSARVRTDPRLLEQMLRNLMSNALKYTGTGRVLLGCRRLPDALRIEVWDTGSGIATAELETVFDAYHQVGNDARKRACGLGLGLSFVQRLGALLGHSVRVRSQPGRGSVFTIEVPLVATQQHAVEPDGRVSPATPIRPVASILVIEDDPDMRELLQQLLADEGFGVTVALDGAAALAMVRGGAAPDLLLADYNLPGGLTGLDAIAGIRRTLPHVPAILLTGDTSAATTEKVAQARCSHLKKPVKPPELLGLTHALLPARKPWSPLAPATHEDSTVVFVVDDDAALRAALRAVLEENGHHVEDFSGGAAFIAALRPGQSGCLLVDAAMPGMSGMAVLHHLAKSGHNLPAIMITGYGDVAMAVDAMKAGAFDFIEKPVSAPDLLAGIARALDRSHGDGVRSAWHATAARSIAGLTTRQRDVLTMVLAGHPSKNIAADLGISQRTVENHRAAIMRKTGTKSLPALARLALAAS